MSPRDLHPSWLSLIGLEHMRPEVTDVSNIELGLQELRNSTSQTTATLTSARVESSPFTMRNFWALPAVLRIALANQHAFSVFDDLLAFPQV
jgi:hypothetical protein